MKRQLCLPLLAGLLGLACSGLAGAQQVRPPCTLRLGTAHGRSIVCRVSLLDLGGAGEDEVRLEFQARDLAGRQRTFRLAAGDCFGFDPASRRVFVGDYVGRGYSQVLVSSDYGRTTSYLYDCDGRRVHVLYARDEGRVGVRPVWKRHGGWRLEESWTRPQFLDDEDALGTGYDRGRGGVVRYLHWDGRGFVSDRPGPTRVLGRPGQELPVSRRWELGLPPAVFNIGGPSVEAGTPRRSNKSLHRTPCLPLALPH